MMKKIKKEHITMFLIGLMTVLLMDLMFHSERYINAFVKGYNKAHQTENVKNKLSKVFPDLTTLGNRTK